MDNGIIIGIIIIASFLITIACLTILFLVIAECFYKDIFENREDKS